MTGKELLYFEDAIMHEQNISKIIDLSIKKLKSKTLINFMKEQKKIHNKIERDLLNKLEAKKMNDTTILENYLLVLKSNVEVYVHGTLESSYLDNQKLLHKCLDEIIDCQRNTYKHLVDLKAYTIENARKECGLPSKFDNYESIIYYLNNEAVTKRLSLNDRLLYGMPISIPEFEYLNKKGDNLERLILSK